MSRTESSGARALGVLLAAWSFGFACVHMAWALGWRGGLPSSFAPISERPWFLAYDVLAGLLMYAAAVVAVLLGAGHTGRVLRRATLAGAVLSLLRGAPALVFDVVGGDYDLVGFGADVWFTVSGILGLLLLRVTRTDAGRSAPRPAPVPHR